MVQTKVGRNEPCPCGSGKKYKRCCGRKPQAQILTQHQWDELFGSLTLRLFHYVTSSRFRKDFESAMLLFLGPDYQFSDSDSELSQEESVFIDYLIHLHKLRSTGRTIISHFLEENRAELTPEERTLLESRINSRYGIFEIQEVRKGEGLTVKDLFDNTVIEVKEKRATETLVTWDVLAVNIVKVGEYFELSGHGDFIPRRIVRQLQAMLLSEYRKYQEKGGTFEFSIFLKDRAYLVHQFISTHVSAPPKIVSKEDDEFVFCTTRFAIHNVGKVLKLIRKNSMFEIEDEDISEDSIKVSSTWFLKGDVARRLGYSSRSIREPYSVFGNLSIEEDVFEFTAHSKRRQEIGTGFLSEKLGHAIEVLDVKYKDVQELVDRTERSDRDRKKARRENEELMKNPEVQAILKQHMDRYYFDEWIHMPLPVLNDLTPVEAYYENPEALDDLLKDLEQLEQRKSSHDYHVDLDMLRGAIAFAADQEELNEFDDSSDVLERTVNRKLTEDTIQFFGIDVYKDKPIEVEENSIGIFSIEDDLLTGRVISVQDSEICVTVPSGDFEFISPRDVVHIYGMEEGVNILNIIEGLYLAAAKTVHFAFENDVNLESEEVDTFQRIVLLENDVLDEIYHIVHYVNNKNIDIDIVEYEKRRRNKRSYFVMKRRTLVWSEADLFQALLYPKDFFELHWDLVKKKAKTVAGRFALFVIYMATLCLYSLEHKRRYDYSDYRFDELLHHVFEQEYESVFRPLLGSVKRRKELKTRRVNKLRNYF